MKKILPVVGLIVAAFVGSQETGFFDKLAVDAPSSSPGVSADTSQKLSDAFNNHVSDLQVAGSGRVTRLLADDNQGSRHQRFLIRTDAGQTVLIAHNIDLASRIDGLMVGDEIEFNGEYEWNDKGGVIHWTHRDPRGRHEAGWLRHQGRTYD
ncbi:MAG: DUF3465 domain-containing protein [Gammaproteobacteria bacterium]|nr:DUF3465 domain-containing protein [Gammaproteobacteria bacterium]